MRFLLLVLIWFGVFIGMFFIISAIGLLWVPSYKQIITDPEWFCAYTLLMGWWMATGVIVDLDKKPVTDSSPLN